ncbi:ATP-binding protein [Paraburkholderia phytofirmans]
MLFELVSARFDRRSLLLTENRPFGEWNKVFPDLTMTIAAVERLVQHSFLRAQCRKLPTAHRTATQAARTRTSRALHQAKISACRRFTRTNDDGTPKSRSTLSETRRTSSPFETSAAYNQIPWPPPELIMEISITSSRASAPTCMFPVTKRCI